MTVTALRTCPECGNVKHLSGRKQPVTRLCRSCASRLACVAWKINPTVIYQSRPPNPDVVNLLVLGIPESATVAERIAAMQLMPKLSAAELARRLGVSERSVVRYRARMRAS